MPKEVTNVILLIADSLRMDGLGCYGNPYAITPHIDALAESGLRFETCYSTSPLCVPARSQMLSGLYCHETGNLANPAWQYHTNQPVEVDGVCFEPEIATLPQILTSQDYCTAHLGKNHFYPRHNRLGFHYMEQSDFYGRWVYEIDDYYLFLKEQGYAHLFKDAFGRMDVVGTGGQGALREEFGHLDRLCPYVSKLPAKLQTTPWLGERARAFIDRHPTGMPFFLVVSFYAPHDPYCVSPPHDTMIDWQDIPLPALPEERQPSARLLGEPSLRTVLPEEMWKKNIAHYLANVALIDREVGMLVERLKERKLYENTLLIITGDHGDTLGEHRIWGKNLLYEACTRVPLIFHHGGGRIATGNTRVTATLLDLFPTILEQTNTPLPDARVAGHALRLDTTQTSDDNRVLIGELANSEHPQYFVRKGRWKLIFLDGHQQFELYDLAEDPGELDNLAESRQDKVHELHVILQDWMEAEALHWMPQVPGIDKVDTSHECELSHL